MPRAERGHRALPHTADVILEAWAPDFGACCEEAISALIAVCIDGSTADIVGEHVLYVPRASSLDSMLLEILDELIFILDTAATLPVRAEAEQQDDGGLKIRLLMALREAVRSTGSVPKGVARSELTVECGPNRVRCAFLVDV
ncbi:MAG: archease [Acidimicrobiia bacterium]|nr:archease [Acidimicrobiia bacterium]MDH5520679.1 archease [Acidimicrobiia bacterium]